MPRRQFSSCRTCLILSHLLLALLALCIPSEAADGTPELLSSYYEVQKTHLLGKTYEHAIFEAKYDDEIYFMRQWACSCVDGGHPCPVSTATVAPAVNETGYTISELLQDEWYHGVIDTEYGLAYHKFTLQPSLEIPCPMIHIDKETETGTLSAFLSVNEIPSASSRLWYAPYFGYSTITICPMHANFSYGTYYVTLVNQRSSSMNSYKLRWRIQNSPTCLASYTPPFSLPTNDTWLQDGIPHEGQLNYSEMDFFAFQSRERCTNLSLSVNKQTQDGDLDLYVSTINQYPRVDDPSSHQWHSTVDGDDRININYCDPNPAAQNVVFFVGVRAGAPGLATYKLVATIQQWVDPYPLTSLAYYQSRLELAYGASPFMNCSNSQIFTCGFPTYSSCFNDDFDCCYRFSPIAPTQNLQGLWPWNEADTTIGDAAWTISWRDVQPLERGKLSWALYMGTSTPDAADEYVFGDPGVCTVTLGNALVARNGDTISPSVLTFTPKPLSCDKTAFNAAKATIDSLSQSLLTAGSFSALSLQQLRLAIASVEPSIAGCEALLLSMVSQVGATDIFGNTTNCYSPEGSSEWNNDPCCNAALLQCCNARPHTTSRTAPSTSLTEVIDAKCNTPECSEASTDSWIDSVNRAESLSSGCDRAVNDAASLSSLSGLSQFITDCRQSIVDEDLMGRKCQTDSDCLAGATCLPLTKRCNHTDQDVVDCLVDSMPYSVSRILYNLWGLTEAVTRPVLSQELNNRVFSYQCIGPTARKFLTGYHWEPQVAGCTDQCSADAADPYCFDRSCEIPEYCDGANVGGACYRFYGPTLNDTDGCVQEWSCNWKKCVVGEPDYTSCMDTCETGSDVCVDCSSGTGCLEVANITTEGRCNQGLCSANSTETSASACALQGVCSSSCPTCNTESGCTSFGSCNDNLLGASGKCIVYPTYNPSSSSYECPTLFALTEIGCIADIASPQCENTFGGSFKVPATTLPTCENSFGCFSSDGTLNYLPQSQCSICSGYEWRSVFTWSTATWTSGTMQQLVWTTRTRQVTNRLGTALSYTRLMSQVSEAITSQYSYAYRTQALCRFDAQLRYVASAACDCNGDASEGKGVNSKCFGSISDSQVGSGLGCSNLENSISTTVGMLQVYNNSFAPSPCTEIGLFFTPPAQYQRTSSFNQALFRASAENSFWIVKNQNDASVGQIISGAIRVQLASDLQNPATLCIDVDLTLEVSDKAVTFAFASLDKDSVISAFPSSTPAYIDQLDRVCASITQSGTYFATKLVEDYEEVKLRTKSETAQYRAAAVIFALVALFGVIQGALLISNRVEERILNMKLLFVGIIIVNCIIRAVFVSLPANAFAGNLAALQFVIFELPSFLFFSVFTAIVYLWLLVVAKTGVLGNRRAMRQRRRYMMRVFIVVNALMYVVFVLFIILIAVLPRLQKSAPCFLGDANSDTSTNNVSYNIKLAYWIFQAVICILVSLGFLGSAFLLLRLMTLSTVATRGTKSPGRRQKGLKRRARVTVPIIIITVVAITCSVVMLIRSSVFLWAAKTGNAVNVLVFAFLETIPQAFLLFYLHPFRVFREASTSSTVKGTNSKGTFELSDTPGTRTSTAGGGGSQRSRNATGSGGNDSSKTASSAGPQVPHFDIPSPGEPATIKEPRQKKSLRPSVKPSKQNGSSEEGYSSEVFYKDTTTTAVAPGKSSAGPSSPGDSSASSPQDAKVVPLSSTSTSPAPKRRVKRAGAGKKASGSKKAASSSKKTAPPRGPERAWDDEL